MKLPNLGNLEWWMNSVHNTFLKPWAPRGRGGGFNFLITMLYKFPISSWVLELKKSPLQGNFKHISPTPITHPLGAPRGFPGTHFPSPGVQTLRMMDEFSSQYMDPRWHCGQKSSAYWYQVLKEIPKGLVSTFSSITSKRSSHNKIF